MEKTHQVIDIVKNGIALPTYRIKKQEQNESALVMPIQEIEDILNAKVEILKETTKLEAFGVIGFSYGHLEDNIFQSPLLFVNPHMAVTDIKEIEEVRRRLKFILGY